ncbi:unnamed protein product, partial [Rhizoctonia solani]
ATDDGWWSAPIHYLHLYYSIITMSAKPESVDCKGVKAAAGTCSYPSCDCEKK